VRSRLALVVSLLAGCTYCDAFGDLERARQGDLAAIQAVGELGDPKIPSSASLVYPRIDEAIAAIASHLDSADPVIRLQTLESVRRLSQRARDVYRNKFPTLFDRLLTDPEAEVRWRAAWALGRLDRTSPALRQAVTDPDPVVADRAAWAVGQARDDEAVEPLLQALEREERVALQAGLALGRITGLKHGSDVAAWQEWGKRWRANKALDRPPGDR
jgi:hypothetical protein